MCMVPSMWLSVYSARKKLQKTVAVNSFVSNGSMLVAQQRLTCSRHTHVPEQALIYIGGDKVHCELRRPFIWSNEHGGSRVADLMALSCCPARRSCTMPFTSPPAQKALPPAPFRMMACTSGLDSQSL